MSDGDSEEPMEVGFDHPPASQDTCAESKDEASVTISVSVGWSEGDLPKKGQIELERALQTWANKGKGRSDCTVLNISDEGTAVITIKPAPALSELQKLGGQTLTRRDGKTVTITSISLTQLDTQSPEEAAVTRSHSFVPEPQQEKVLPAEQSFNRSAAVSTAREETCTCPVPVGHFWYVSHIYKEEIERIQKDNGVQIRAEVNVSFQTDQEDEGPQKALSEFISLVQKCLGESEGSVFPFKYLGPEELKDTLTIIRRPENKVLLTLSSEQVTVCGPQQSQDIIRKSLNAAQKTLTNADTSAGESARASQDASLNIGMMIKDPLIDAGLNIEADYWRLMNTSFGEQLAMIKAKFGVDFKESPISPDRVEVRARYKRSAGNASMESHAVRALLHLYQKTATSPMTFTQRLGAMALSGSPKNLSNVYQSEGASASVLNGQSGYSTHSTDALTGGGGAPAGDSKEENCPICMDRFTNKKQLKCKHEFCEECLENAKKTMGPICPVCKHVFGMVEGDQPDGRMSWHLDSRSLPGFPNCGTIIITYDIPSGTQKKQHPNPGTHYSGIYREAYLPDSKDGREVLQLLKRAFDQKLIFTVGVSRTTGKENQVTWNDIHHKTSPGGGPESFGYPDSGYLSRVREELKAKGIK